MLLMVMAVPADAQPRRPLAVSVGGQSAQWRPIVRIGGLLRDPALREALQNGLPLRLEFRVEMWRKEDPFDQLAGVQTIQRAVLRAPLGEGYTLEDGRVQRRYSTLEAAEAALQAALQPSLRPETGGRFYYLVTLNVQTLSASDLEELRHWLRGQARPAAAGKQPVGRAVETGVRRFFVRLLGLPTRRYETRTPIFAVR
ncbi:MAG TPA: hypothetical protein VE871_06255 [Longimicrobium sp.]|nr:hypothetical protein [Longimicrobium sp.]